MPHNRATLTQDARVGSMRTVGSPKIERCEHRVGSICDECAKISKK